jgi:hypothetical protein
VIPSFLTNPSSTYLPEQDRTKYNTKNPQSLFIGGNYKGEISTHWTKNLDSEKLVNKKFLARRGFKLLRVPCPT